MKLTVDVRNLGELKTLVERFSERRLNAAAATALTRTAVLARDAVQAHMAVAFDKPTPYTVRQLRYVPATAANPVAVVGFNVAAIQDIRGRVIRYQDLGAGQTPAGKYLQFQIDGGTRAYKRFEVALRRVGVLPDGWQAVPGERAKMTPYGNQSVGELRQILSYFDAAELVAGSRQNMGDAGRAKRLKGTRKKAGFDYFVSQPGGRRSFVRPTGGKGSHAMQPGIYRRTYTSFGTRLEPVVIFVRNAKYRARFNFNGVVQQVVDRELQQQMRRAIEDSARRMAGSTL